MPAPVPLLSGAVLVAAVPVPISGNLSCSRLAICWGLILCCRPVPILQEVIPAVHAASLMKDLQPWTGTTHPAGGALTRQTLPWRPGKSFVQLQVNQVLVVRVSGSAHLTNVLLSRLKLRSLITTAAEPAVSQSKAVAELASSAAAHPHSPLQRQRLPRRQLKASAQEAACSEEGRSHPRAVAPGICPSADCCSLPQAC